MLEGELARREADVRAREQRIAELEETLGGRNAEVARLEQELAGAQVELARVQSLLSRQGEQYAELQERILQLSQVEREIRERNRIYEDVLYQFRSLIDAGRLSVEIVRGRMVIQLPQDILFASGSATLSAEGRQTLREVGDVLAGIGDRSFQIEGHTDNVPIATERFPSNWELSSARAMSV
ncbi:MAG TPA: OmpA family protein, partial [Longimicrobiales bacterium]|nr:OmpA family protein [Longimicrobiales bacterium]